MPLAISGNRHCHWKFEFVCDAGSRKVEAFVAEKVFFHLGKFLLGHTYLSANEGEVFVKKVCSSESGGSVAYFQRDGTHFFLLLVSNTKG